ncbi:TPA: hypothetical protein NU789_001731 [Acinetobacter baumannii]|uniref:hypothetical protein n=1 Tax=Acinetobacter baumannii TaxID=470 RepID=UPI000B544EC0|nr:hypothetical protein [Acinetobacter baumannii]MBV6563109.1 hypothetical protein [Acinetobacter baumannii]MBV6588285.1 hypothetical protein [Acinetobacter baumannii]MDT1780360.1 hypothetical protein [Acinetobacter baumannii]OWX15394.1 hypothetical protein A7A33_00955 [Acinetobacter baumannii]PRO10153.1 hypothetical protein B9W31_19120 [Acinetobacter baumannii]
MDNYKIKVKDEAGSKEAQELFFDLGYEWRDSKRDITNLDATHIYADDGVLTFGFNDFNFRGSDNEELTLPQLRDLVVLKRNDINDANCIDKKREAWYLASDGTYYAWQYRKLCWDTESDACVEAHDIKPITKPQDPALISGAEALRALADGKEVEANNSDFGYWIDARNLSVKDFFDDIHIFRLKPQTIKLELELPKPFEPEEDCHVYILDDGKTDGYRRYSYEVHGDKGNTFIGIWKTEDEIKQVVEQLRKIRGTNS